MHAQKPWLLLVLLFVALLPSLVHCQEWTWKRKYEAGKEALDQQRYLVAVDKLEDALKTAEAAAINDWRLGDTLSALAMAHIGRKEYTEAEPLLLRALANYEKSKGPTSATMAHALNDLGDLYSLLGKYDKAEPLYMRAISIFEKNYGDETSELVGMLNSLSDHYYGKHQYDDAEKYASRSLAISEKTWGTKSQLLLPSMNILCKIYLSHQKYTEAEPLLKRSLAISEKAYGKDDPNLNWVIEALAKVYQVRGQYAEAEVLYNRSLAIWQKNLPVLNQSSYSKKRYVEYAQVLNEQGLTLYNERKPEKYPISDYCFQQALMLRKTYLGENHLDVAEVYQNLGELYRVENRYADAIKAIELALGIRQKADDQSVETAISLNSQGVLYYLTGDAAKAETALKASLTIREKLLPADDPDVGITINTLAMAYYVDEKYTDAEPYFKRALAIWEKAPGAKSARLITCLENYARLLEKLDRREEAADLLTRAREIREKEGQ